MFRRREDSTSPKTYFLVQSRKAPTERVFSIIQLPKLVTKRSRTDVEDSSFAEGFGIMSQGTEFAKFLCKDSVTCNKKSVCKLQMGTMPNPQNDVMVIGTNLVFLLLIWKGQQMAPGGTCSHSDNRQLIFLYSSSLSKAFQPHHLIWSLPLKVETQKWNDLSSSWSTEVGEGPALSFTASWPFVKTPPIPP